MKLTIFAEGQTMPLEVPDALLQDAEEFFSRIDGDMDGGWQMSRRWIDKPDVQQRCQIVADRLLDAMHGGKVELTLLLAAYLLKRAQGLEAVRYGEEGDVSAIELVRGPH